MPRPQHVPFVLRGCALLIRRFIALFAFGISLLSSGVAIAQTSPAPVPAQALPFSPRVPHVNAPLGDIPRIPGDGNGAYKMRSEERRVGKECRDGRGT